MLLMGAGKTVSKRKLRFFAFLLESEEPQLRDIGYDVDSDVSSRLQNLKHPDDLAGELLEEHVAEMGGTLAEAKFGLSLLSDGWTDSDRSMFWLRRQRRKRRTQLPGKGRYRRRS